MTDQWFEEKVRIVDASVAEVFKRMLWEECRTSRVDWAEGERIRAAIEMHGVPEARCTVEVASSAGDLLTDSLLGTQGDWDDELIEDAVGELCNMVTGCIKSRLGVRPGQCRISLPKVVRVGGDSRRVDESVKSRWTRVGEQFETVRRLYWFGQSSTLAVTLELRREVEDLSEWAVPCPDPGGFVRH